MKRTVRVFVGNLKNNIGTVEGVSEASGYFIIALRDLNEDATIPKDWVEDISKTLIT